MDTLVVRIESEEQIKLVQDFLQQHNMQSRVLTDEDKEDIVLGKLMEETDYEQTINSTDFLRNLRG